jgi:UDP-N-acetylglucosamine 2-epimerase (non-hydrolysing)
MNTDYTMSETRIAVVLGTRPEIIKLSPVIRAAQRRDIPFTLIHTGQHYSKDLDEVFFEDLNLPRPDHNLGVGSASQGKQTGEMLVRIEEVLTADEPDVVLVQGDTNSVLAGAVAAAKLTPKIGHVEAGLRSYDRAMPEETNRVLTDHASDYLFAPTADAADNLSKEGIDGERVFVTGNTVVDAVQQNQTLAAEHSSVLSRLNVEEGEFVLMTAHRAENVDNDDRFIDIFSSAEQVAAEFELPVIYPIHPRAKQRIDEFDISVPDAVRLVDPLDFLDFLRLEDAARLVLTDSGGVQEETCILGTPCVTMRDSTERPETVEVGANTVVGTAPADVLEGAKLMVTRTDDWSNPFGDGSAADRILDIVIDED